MNGRAYALLPGLDGTGELFDRFVSSAPEGVSVCSLRLPDHGSQSYTDLARRLSDQLPPDPIVLIAESFSGPLGIHLARGHRNVLGLVLCATFVVPPLPQVLARLPNFIWKRLPPAFAVRLFLTGGDQSLALALRHAVARVPIHVLMERVAAALRVDVTRELQDVTQPILYLRATRDRLVPSRSSAIIQNLKPSVQVVDVHGPHLLLQSNPVDAWNHIAWFRENASVHPAG